MPDRPSPRASRRSGGAAADGGSGGGQGGVQEARVGERGGGQAQELAIQAACLVKPVLVQAGVYRALVQRAAAAKRPRFRDEGLLDQAIHLLMMALAGDGGDAALLAHLAPFLSEADREAAAGRAFAHAVALGADDPWFQLDHAIFLGKSGQYDAALAQLATLVPRLEAQPGSDPNNNLLGHARLVRLAVLGEIGRAEEALSGAIPYLSHPELWERASSVADGAATELGLDTESLIDRCFDEGAVAPDQVAWRLDWDLQDGN